MLHVSFIYLFFCVYCHGCDVYTFRMLSVAYAVMASEW
jgi:hypothetical protein